MNIQAGKIDFNNINIIRRLHQAFDSLFGTEKVYGQLTAGILKVTTSASQQSDI